MGRRTTPSIAKQTALTKRQQLNLRTETARYAGMTAKRLALFSAGLKSVKDEEGNETLVELTEDDAGMSMAEIRAAEIILRKTMPDLQSVHLVEEDEYSNLTRDELEARLKDMVTKNPQLAVVAGIIPKTIDAEVIPEGHEVVPEKHEVVSDNTIVGCTAAKNAQKDGEVSEDSE